MMRGRALRIGDFTLADGRVTLRKTGNGAAIDGRLIREVLGWLLYHYTVRLLALRHLGRRRPAIWFTPDVPHPRYMIRTAALFAGLRLARDAASADAAFFFEDATVSPPQPAPAGPAFSFACTDISKSRVAAVFAQVFGYPLAIDPRTHHGPAVEKSEANGTHDGRIVACPCDPAPGKAYQRLIDTIAEDGLATDLRTHCIGGQPIVVWVKRRLPAERFLPPNLSVTRHAPAGIFSPAEQACLGRFTAAMGADWCGLDVLRDRDGRLYVVDVNKTDAGPIAALPLREKLASTRILAAALVALLPAAAR